MSDSALKKTPITKMNQLRPGDHLAVSSSMLPQKLQLYHHGIYLGAEIGVADFDGVKKCIKVNAKLGIRDILEFTEYWKLDVVRIDYGEKDCLSPEETINYAIQLVNNPSCWKSFHILKNNCEHFATFCKTGKAMSYQAEEFMVKCIICPSKIGSYFEMSKCANFCAKCLVKSGRSITPWDPAVGSGACGASIALCMFARLK